MMASGVHPFGAPCILYSAAGLSSSNAAPSPTRVPSGTSQVAYSRTPDPDSDPLRPPKSLCSISAMPQFNWPPTGPLSHEELRLADYHAGFRLGVHDAAHPHPHPPPRQVPLAWQQTPQPLAAMPQSQPQPQTPPGLQLFVFHGASMVGPLSSAPASGGASPSRAGGDAAMRHTVTQHGGFGAATTAAAAAAPPAPAAATVGPDSQPAGTRLAPYCPTLDIAPGEASSSAPSYSYIMSVSAMALYSGLNAQSHEELRWQDRQAGVRSRNNEVLARAAAGSPGGQLTGTRFLPYCPTLNVLEEASPSAPSYDLLLSISAMAQYSTPGAQSHEELRWQDRQAGVRSRSDVGGAGGTIPPHARYSWTRDSQEFAWLTSISAMQEFNLHGPQSHEELRWLDRQAGVRSRKDVVRYGAGASPAAGAAASSSTVDAAAAAATAAAPAVSRAGPAAVSFSGAGPGAIARDAWTAAPTTSASASPWSGRPSRLTSPGTPPQATPGPAYAAASATPAPAALLPAAASRTATAPPPPPAAAAAPAAAAPAPGPARAPPPPAPTAVPAPAVLQSAATFQRVTSPQAASTAAAAAGAAAPGPTPAPGPSQAAAPRASAATAAAGPRAAQAATAAVGPSTSRAGAGAAASGSGGAGGGSGMEGLCCVCLDRRAEFGFVHKDAVHLCLCSGCEADARLLNKLRRCFLCNAEAMFVTKVYAT